MFSVSGWLELSHVTRNFEVLAKIAPKGAAPVSEGATTSWTGPRVVDRAADTRGRELTVRNAVATFSRAPSRAVVIVCPFVGIDSCLVRASMTLGWRGIQRAIEIDASHLDERCVRLGLVEHAGHVGKRRA